MQSTSRSPALLPASKRNDHRAWPRGGLPQLRAIRCASTSPSILRRLGRGDERLSNAASRPCSTNRRLTRSIFLIPTERKYTPCLAKEQNGHDTSHNST